MFFNRKYKKQLRSIPIPVELFVVVVGTLVSGLLDLDGNNKVDVVGPIKQGLIICTIVNLCTLKNVLYNL